MMSSRGLVKNLIAGMPAPRCGFWLGNPHSDTWPVLHAYFGTGTEEELRRKLGDDFRWISPSLIEPAFLAPDDRRARDFAGSKTSHGQAGPLADMESPDDLDRFEWPDPEILAFDHTLGVLREAGPFYRAGGYWSPFFHNIMDLFGMDQYFIKMFTHPELVLAATERVCRFYHAANEKFFDSAGNLIDGFFFGNDFGTQLDLMMSPELFDRFVMPWFKTFTEQAKRRGLQVILHSCGSIHRVIGRLIDAGVDCLHPLQAMARNMDAETLSRDFGGRVTFLGGVDTQRVLNAGSPETVKDEVRRIKDVLGPRLIVSPSHEALLPDVPPRNVAAMAEAALA